MSTHEDLVDRYLATWNETDPAARRTAIAGVWTEDGHYVDPVMSAGGHPAIEAMIAGVQARFPGMTMRRAGAVDGHNDRLRFGWELGPDGGPGAISGIDFATVADGRLATVTGFIDYAPAGTT